MWLAPACTVRRSWHRVGPAGRGRARWTCSSGRPLAALARGCGHKAVGLLGFRPGRGCAALSRGAESQDHLGSSGTDGQGCFSDLFANAERRRFIFVGGKGGVGKTTTAAALAVSLAKSGMKTLVVSTDPAHSLGDALATNLSGEPQKVALADERGTHLLYGMEIDPAEVIEKFRRTLQLDQLQAMLREQRGGLGASLLTALAQAGVDIDVLASLLDFSPPGIDEAVALGQMVQILEDPRYKHFQRIVIDTAPTGHTLRLLSFPQFLHGLIGTILSINAKVMGTGLVGHILGQVVGDDLPKQLQVSKANLERIMAAMGSLSSIMEDQETTNFVVVAIPTHLAVTESKRLLHALRQAQMPVRHIIINQCPFLSARTERGSNSDVLESAQAAADKFADGHKELGITETEIVALRQIMTRLRRQHEDAQKQVAILEAEVGPNMALCRMPVFEEELTGVVALERYAAMLRAA